MATLRPITRDEIPAIARAGKAQACVEDFLASGLEAAEVEDDKKSFHISLSRYVKNSGAPVQVMKRKDVVYLARLDGQEPQE